MMLFKLAFKNIKKSISNYVIYFLTLILGVSIFYIFNAIDSQTAMIMVSESTQEIIELMIDMLNVVSVFVSCILGFLIIYASRFLIKRRNKEFGIYMTLGMSKSKISKILLTETILIGLLSLVVGLAIGCALSQIMSVIVANMFEADLTNFTFVISKSAIIKTIIYFAIMYLIVMIFNTISVSKCKLIDLINGSKKTEKIKLKNPYLSIIIFIITVIIMGYSYYQVSINIEALSDTWRFILVITLGVLGTFLFFFSLSGLIIRVLQSFKKIYYKGLNSFIIKQFSSKINTTIFSMTIICLMLFITICVFSSCMSMKNAMTYNLTTLAPVDIELTKTKNDSYDLDESIIKNLEDTGFDLDKYLDDVVVIYSYTSTDLTLKTTLGSFYEEISNEYSFISYSYDEKETIITISDYNKIAKVLGLETYSLEDDEYILMADYKRMVDIRNVALEGNVSITISSKVYYPKYNECMDGFLLISNSHITSGVFIVPDDAVSDLVVEKEYMYANYNANTDEEKQEIEDLITSKIDEINADETYVSLDTKLSIYERSVGLGAMVVFIGLYLGIVFLISSAAILALKELSESADNKERFRMLRKLGADEKLLNQALFKQIFIFFMFPLLLAIIHSIFGIMFCNYVLETFGNETLLLSITLTAIFIVIIYGGYLLITYLCSKNIIKERR